MFIGNDQTLKDLRTALDATALRQKVIANNLANINTPRFKRSYVSFEDDLKRARESQVSHKMRATHQQHFQAPAEKDIIPQVKQDQSSTVRIDGNNVDMETEMLDMVTNQLRHNVLVQRISGRLSSWKLVITEGRG